MKKSISQIPARSSLQKKADEINTLNGEITEAANTSLKKAIRVGKLLTEIKNELGHGKFLSWLEKNVPFDRSTAARWMRLWERREELKCSSVLHLTDAYRLLSCGSGGPPPRPQPVTINNFTRGDAEEIASVVAHMVDQHGVPLWAVVEIFNAVTAHLLNEGPLPDFNGDSKARFEELKAEIANQMNTVILPLAEFAKANPDLCQEEEEEETRNQNATGKTTEE